MTEPVPSAANVGLDLTLEALRERHGLTGAAAAVWEGGRLRAGSAGVRNSVTGDPLTPDTLLPIGSVTKLLNVVLLMQLVDEGRIGLDDPVVRHLPELRLRDVDAVRRITCRMLVNHTSGIDGDMLPDHGPDRERIEDAIARCADLGQVHAPGQAASYCNMGTVIAGRVVEAVRGASWYDLVKARIFQPLELQHALCHPTDLPRFRHSVGDLTDPTTGALVQTRRPFLPLSFAPAGATAMMAAADLVTFGRMLVSEGLGPNGVRILSPGAVATMMQPSARLEAPRYDVGLGWHILPSGLLTHGGTTPGGVARLCAWPATGAVAAFLTNCDRKAAVGDFMDPIVVAWTGAPFREPMPRRLDGAPAGLECEGLYETRLQRVLVSAEGERLELALSWKTQVLDNSPMPGAPRRFRLAALADGAFLAEPCDGAAGPFTLRFVGGEGRAPQFLAMDGRLLPRVPGVGEGGPP